MQIDREWIRDFGLGIHSKIPLCCVVYFCNIWVPLYGRQDKQRVHNARDFARWDRGEFKKNSAKYIQCPDCFDKGYIVKLHYCKPDQRKCFTDELDRLLYRIPKLKQPKKKKKKSKK